MADLQVAATIAARGLDVEFTVPGGEVLAVLGPNGAGKSTTAAVIAGLLPADRAVVKIGDRVLTDTGCSVAVPVHARRVGVLLQDPMLFPHMTVLGNVLFAARHRISSRGDTRERALYWLDAVGAGEFAGQRPAALSGGQAQRVAVARALAAEPDLVVLDEPLAGLDVASAATVRTVLRQVLTEAARPAVLITHDLLDVVTLADRVMVLESGRIAETGRVADVLSSPRSRFGARMAGVNLVQGVVGPPGQLRSPNGRTWHGVGSEPLAAGQDAVAVFTPAAVAVYRDRPHGSPRNSVAVRITGVEINGTVARLRAVEQAGDGPGLAADVTTDALAELRIVVGDALWFTVKTQEVSLHGGRRSEPSQR